MGESADLVPLSREPPYRQGFARRIRRTFQDEAGAQFEAWCARPIDLDYVTSQAVTLGALVVELWTRLQEQALADIQSRFGPAGAMED